MQKNLSPIGGKFNSYLNIFMQTTNGHAKTFFNNTNFLEEKRYFMVIFNFISQILANPKNKV